jgi:hypothetical protein
MGRGASERPLTGVGRRDYSELSASVVRRAGLSRSVRPWRSVGAYLARVGCIYVHLIGSLRLFR